MNQLPRRGLPRSPPATRPVWEVDLLNAPNSQSVSSEINRNTSDMEMSFPACLSEITKNGEAFDARNHPGLGLEQCFSVRRQRAATLSCAVHPGSVSTQLGRWSVKSSQGNEGAWLHSHKTSQRAGAGAGGGGRSGSVTVPARDHCLAMKKQNKHFIYKHKITRREFAFLTISGCCFFYQKTSNNYKFSSLNDLRKLLKIKESRDRRAHLSLQGAAPLLQQVDVLYRGAGLVGLDLLVCPLREQRCSAISQRHPWCGGTNR